MLTDLVLGDGKQKKSYLHVLDCIDAIMISLDHNQMFNLQQFINAPFCFWPAITNIT